VPSLTYSDNALNTLTYFHRRKYIFYVEGKDDVPFWNTILKKIGIKQYIIKIAGGKNEINKYVNAIIQKDTNIYVIRDCDYTDILNIQINNPKILYTYGYSIENSLYCPRNIAEAIAIYARQSELYMEEVEQWLTELVSMFEDLIIFDIGNEKYKKGINVLNDNIMRYMKSSNSHVPNKDKIEKKISEIKKYFTKDELQTIKKLITESDKELRYIIRGHFISNAVMSFIKWKSSVSPMTNDMLYGQMIAQLQETYKHNVEYQKAKAKFSAIIKRKDGKRK